MSARVGKGKAGVAPPATASPKKRPGRPRKDLGAEQIEQVEKLAPYLTQEQLADFLGIGERTLRLKLNEDPALAAAYARGRAKAFADVATSLVQQAKEGSAQAAIFYLKSQAGWRDKAELEISGDPAAPLTVRIVDETRGQR